MIRFISFKKALWSFLSTASGFGILFSISVHLTGWNSFILSYLCNHSGTVRKHIITSYLKLCIEKKRKENTTAFADLIIFLQSIISDCLFRKVLAIDHWHKTALVRPEKKIIKELVWQAGQANFLLNIPSKENRSAPTMVFNVSGSPTSGILLLRGKILIYCICRARPYWNDEEKLDQCMIIIRLIKLFTYALLV